MDNIVDILTNQSAQFIIGSVGSPSNTTEIVIDINAKSEQRRVLGQLVYLVQEQEQEQLVVIGQISEVETKNRWHEDLTFRGIIKRQGSLPHLSGRADIRTATLNVQACFSISINNSVSEGTLGISPTTGTPIYTMRDEVLDGLLKQYANQIIYLGHAYATEVKLPLWLKHFDRDKSGSGAGEAYHIGVFGKNGSGKSGLAAYMLLGYAKHNNLGVIFIDPQNQFTSDTDLPFSLHQALKNMGREVYTYSITNQIRLGTKKSAVKLFTSLLLKTSFYRSIGVRKNENQVYASEEVARIIDDVLSEENLELKNTVDSFCETVLQRLSQNDTALGRIYGRNSQPYKRLVQDIETILNSERELGRINEIWQPVLDLFLEKDSRGNQRQSLWHIVSRAATSDKKPIVFLDIKGEGTSFSDNEEVKALILKDISIILRVAGENAFKENRKLNCLVCLDEAHRYVKGQFSGGDSSEMANLTRTFVDGVRTTRKYGLGYMFITQTLASLHKEIIQQLRLFAFGYGLTSGSEYRQIEELVSDKQALNLYKSFVDPQSNKQFPYMFIGPISPLSFTGSPLFMQSFTNFEDFKEANKLDI